MPSPVLTPSRSYFISGASSGLGAEMSRQLVARGDRVAIAARRGERLERLAAELGEESVSIHVLDVTNPGATRAAIRQADEHWGGLDVVVVNAGRGGGVKLGAGGDTENRAVMDTNLMGALAQIEAAMELFRERGKGHLVLVSSMAANRGLPKAAAVYSASKAALASLGESLRIELAGSGIEVTTLRPGYVKTELSSRARFPFMTPLDRGAASMLAAIDSGAGDRVIPPWPWKPASWLLKVLPGGLLKRFM